MEESGVRRSRSQESGVRSQEIEESGVRSQESGVQKNKELIFHPVPCSLFPVPYSLFPIPYLQLQYSSICHWN
ncbi:MAG: hypothetical protein EAZ76_00550 [Nostocales cyanobacterium]|nr:MAG: hypothetical protein EAZ87_10175 [Nostocales cyanobacterium]TAF21325.1 MAG: hypothetical protein EAZ76_00550 [Nostocales cyanobacterium]